MANGESSLEGAQSLSGGSLRSELCKRGFPSVGNWRTRRANSDEQLAISNEQLAMNN